MRRDVSRKGAPSPARPGARCIRTDCRATGFEYIQAEVANAAAWKVTAGESLVMEHENTHAHLAKFTWSSDRTTS